MTAIDLKIRAMRSDDWAAVRAIYEEGIASGHATFETTAPSWEAWDASHLTTCRLVAIRVLADPAEAATPSDCLIGWAALTPVSGRCVYAGVAEVSVYVAAALRGSGVGRRLLDALVTQSERQGLWTLQASVFPENAASLGAHTRAGFRIVGTRERLGQLKGVWRDVLLLERRSGIAG